MICGPSASHPPPPPPPSGRRRQPRVLFGFLSVLHFPGNCVVVRCLGRPSFRPPPPPPSFSENSSCVSTSSANLRSFFLTSSSSSSSSSSSYLPATPLLRFLLEGAFSSSKFEPSRESASRKHCPGGVERFIHWPSYESATTVNNRRSSFARYIGSLV